MTNKVFSQLVDQKIEIFRSSFKNAHDIFYDQEIKKLKHAGEFGTYREQVTKDFLQFFIPQRLRIGTGFVIEHTGGVSTQCDIIVYDHENTPLVEDDEKQRFFPIETVCAIGEVKSTIRSKEDLAVALNKLAVTKIFREKCTSPVIRRNDSLRNQPIRFNPIQCAFDQVPTFLICEKFDFSDPASVINEFDSMYDKSIAYRHRHNLILSLEDGIFLYADSSGVAMMYPEIGGSLQDRAICPDDSRNVHLRMLCSYFFLLTSSCTTLYPDITEYLSLSSKGGKSVDKSKET